MSVAQDEEPLTSLDIVLKQHKTLDGGANLELVNKNLTYSGNDKSMKNIDNLPESSSKIIQQQRVINQNQSR